MRRRWMLGLVIPVLLGGCSTWATVPPPVQPVVAEREGEHVQVKVAGRAAFDLHDIQVVGDSLVGTTGAGTRYAVATEDAEYVRVQKTDNFKTALLMAGVIALVAFLLVSMGSAAGTGTVGF